MFTWDYITGSMPANYAAGEENGDLRLRAYILGSWAKAVPVPDHAGRQQQQNRPANKRAGD